MSGFISKQPNGLYCRFSTVIDCPTHYNMTEEEYLKNVTGNVRNESNGQDILNNHLIPFSEVIEGFVPNNMTQKQFDKLIEEMSEFPKTPGFKST
ncbi:hypothetical protein [Clostridium estertheticum]|uniref:hypothetical protein n=1 Tax=Clostridium estertheticum TaxID=238834 RepID=UPI001C7D5EE0|nr:hypothetical protein [Clostridium estertheticum]MBX4272033.1 hypothetical protein [Clostridium estertheticum]WLC82418.1 hypothetical protein KTC98_24135 [Clostridium estertheticum]